MSKAKSAPALTMADVVDWTGVPLQRIQFEPAATIFAQGDPAPSVMYVDSGAVRLSVVSQERVVAHFQAAMLLRRLDLQPRRRKHIARNRPLILDMSRLDTGELQHCKKGGREKSTFLALVGSSSRRIASSLPRGFAFAPEYAFADGA